MRHPFVNFCFSFLLFFFICYFHYPDTNYWHLWMSYLILLLLHLITAHLVSHFSLSCIIFIISETNYWHFFTVLIPIRYYFISLWHTLQTHFIISMVFKFDLGSYFINITWFVLTVNLKKVIGRMIEWSYDWNASFKRCSYFLILGF